MAGGAEGEFDHVRLAHDRRQLPAQIGDDRAIDLEFVRQAFGRASIGRKARNAEEVLDRSRDALQGTRPRTNGKSGIGGVGTFSRVLGCPLRICQQLGAETLVIGDRLFGESPRLELALAKQHRNLGHRKRERTGHLHFLIRLIFAAARANHCPAR
jgi:hypothetical protein